mmetsp:Transcript_3756/g.13546  ORF Transcript_3756/g.13546 Transcript_3756/m.13546 type:complete len:382 (+) Transcript_3756:1303-2448(+)
MSLRLRRRSRTPMTRRKLFEFLTSNASSAGAPRSKRTSVRSLHARATNDTHFVLDTHTFCNANDPLNVHFTRFGAVITARSMEKHPSALSSSSVDAHMRNKSSNPLDVKLLQLSNVSVRMDVNFVRTVLISSVIARNAAQRLSSNVSHCGAKQLNVSIARHPAALSVSTEFDCTCNVRNAAQSATLIVRSAFDPAVRLIMHVVIVAQFTALIISSRAPSCASSRNCFNPEHPVTSSTRTPRAASSASLIASSSKDTHPGRRNSRIKSPHSVSMRLKPFPVNRRARGHENEDKCGNPSTHISTTCTTSNSLNHSPHPSKSIASTLCDALFALIAIKTATSARLLSSSSPSASTGGFNALANFLKLTRCTFGYARIMDPTREA